MKTMRSEIVGFLEDKDFNVISEFNGMFVTIQHSGISYLLDLRMDDRYMLSCEVTRPKDLDVEAFRKVVDRSNIKAKGLNVHYDKVSDVAVITSTQFSSCVDEFSKHFVDCLGLVSDTACALKKEIDDEQLPFLCLSFPEFLRCTQLP